MKFEVEVLEHSRDGINRLQAHSDFEPSGDLACECAGASADGKIVPGREYENVLDVPMADAKAEDALISPGYVIETREIQ